VLCPTINVALRSSGLLDTMKQRSESTQMCVESSSKMVLSSASTTNEFDYFEHHEIPEMHLELLSLEFSQTILCIVNGLRKENFQSVVLKPVE
jgi:hypothetical protein